MNWKIMFDRIFKPTAPAYCMRIGSKSVPLVFVHHPRARRYLLRLRQDGVARITIPRRGTVKAAKDFASRNVDWLEQQFQRLAEKRKTPDEWKLGSEISFRGELVRIEVAEDAIRFGTESIKIADHNNLKPAIQRHLRILATRELPMRVQELAQTHGVNVGKVSVRNQRTRWGSCSHARTISLNWLLIQTPNFVRDYIILHELAHLRFMNHSKAYWAEVERLCPGYLDAERWLKEHRELMR